MRRHKYEVAAAPPRNPVKLLSAAIYSVLFLLMIPHMGGDSGGTAVYYALQCLVATMSCATRGAHARAVGFAALMLLCVAIVIFGTPAEGG